MKPNRSAVLLLCLILGFARVGFAQAFWQWSPSGASHHQSVVIVRSPSGDAGSGVVVKHNGATGVLTVAHVASGQSLTVTFADGTRKSGDYTTDKFGFDLAWVMVKDPPVPAVPLATSSPKIGDRVEFVTYGGPKDQLRHFYGTVKSSDSKSSTFNVRVINGDSGGAIFNARGEVVGIQSYGQRTIATTVMNGTNWPIYDGSGSAPHSAIASFSSRVCERFYCPPVASCPPIQGGGLYPQPMVPVKPQPKPAQPPNVKIEIDYERIAGLVLQRMNQEPDRFKGPPGNDGRDGKDGKNGMPGMPGSTPVLDHQRLADEVVKRLPPITVEYQGRGFQPVREETVPLGGKIIIPPVRMEVHHEDGQVYYQEKPLGGTIALELIPRQ